MDPVTTIHIEAVYVALLAGTIAPILVGLITKYQASHGLKAVVAFLLTAVVAVINTITSTDGTFVVRDTVLLFFIQFITHTAMHFGLYKPADVPLHLMPEAGIGPAVDPIQTNHIVG